MSRATSFILDDDLKPLMDKEANKTRTINTALRMYFAKKAPKSELMDFLVFLRRNPEKSICCANDLGRLIEEHLTAQAVQTQAALYPDNAQLWQQSQQSINSLTSTLADLKKKIQEAQRLDEYPRIEDLLK